ncbi:MAG: hypothetical protein MJD61_15100, partial [Proteobacteria bacterium]|nr:hypothetical protein [Pseudomonadota bacterium]
MRVYAQLLLVAWVLGCGRIGYAPLHEPAPEPGIDGGAGGWNADSGPSDGALPDAGLDGTIDACTSSSGIEVCNGLDDDCDGTIDEGDPSLLCPAPNATSVCSNGNCSLTGCVGPYGDCDGVSANGCEEPLNTPTSCGGCEVACALEHASASCAGGSCEILGCDTHWGNCNAVDSDGCETPLTTLGNCGACNAGCDYANAGESCGGGACSLGACDTRWGD